MANSKKIDIVSGNGENLKISKVKDHLNLDKRKKSVEIDKNTIIIPSKNPKK